MPEISDHFKTFTSAVISLPLKDIDTDLIIPATFLKTTTKEGLGKHVFSNLRKMDVDFPLFNGPRILVTGKNFGCGSSREHAPWALKDAGIDVIITSEFADIFRGNAEKNEILPLVLPENIVQNFLANPLPLTINLEAQIVTDSAGNEYSFRISDFTKKRLLYNLSDLDYLNQFSTQIKSFEQQQNAKNL